MALPPGAAEGEPVETEVPGVAPGQNERHFEDRIRGVDARGSGEHVDEIECEPAQRNQAREQPEDEGDADRQFSECDELGNP